MLGTSYSTALHCLSLVLLTTILLKESVDMFGKDLRKENMDESLLILVRDELNLESCMLNEEGVEITNVIAGYMSKVIFDKSNCDVCNTWLTTVKSDSSKFKCLDKISRKGLVTPIIDLLHYVSKSFCYFRGYY